VERVPVFLLRNQLPHGDDGDVVDGEGGDECFTGHPPVLFSADWVGIDGGGVDDTIV